MVEAIRAAGGRRMTGPAALTDDLGRAAALTWTLGYLEFRLRFFGSVLGYLWQLGRPLMMFGVYYVVFTKFVDLGAGVPFYAPMLLFSIMLFQFFAEVTGGSVGAVLILIDDGVVQPYVDLDTYTATVTATKLNDDWHGRENHGHCGLAADDPATDDDETRVCDDPSKPVPTIGSGQEAAAVHIADFLYLPGDQSVPGDLGRPVLVTQGEPLLFVNEDAAIGVRHTVTSCRMPCNGAYVANYPQPDGFFDSDKMGNLDYIDGGLVSTGGEQEILGHEYEGPGIPASTYPQWELETSDLEPGMYSYYCRIHPWMRGWLEVAPAA